MKIKKLVIKILTLNFDKKCVSFFYNSKMCLILLMFFTCSTFLQAQHEKNIWYFGDHAGLSFAGGNPVAITNNTMFCGDNSASFSDADSGNLLFYSNGDSVWNRNHTVMPNGSGLLGNITGGDCAFAVKQPGSDSLFYLFTCDAFGWSNGLRYSIIDMSLNGGLGDVTSTKNVQLVNPSTEKITAIRHANNVDIWIITHPWNSNAFYVYLLTSSGLSTSPIVTTIGSTHAGGTSGYYNAMGQMSASPNGDKLVCAIYDLNVYELFDFNRNTGALSNFISISGYSHAFGTEFSSDGTKLYTTRWQYSSIYQFDLSSNNQSTINSSATVVGTATTPHVLYKCGYLQRGPDDKIYVAKYSSTYLGVIDSPNSPGLSCNYIDNGIYLGGKISQGGLPSFMQTITHVLTITDPAPVCFPNIVDLTAAAVTAGSSGGGILTYWSDSSATILLSNPATIDVSGTYYIKVAAAGGFIDIKPVNVTINQIPVADAGVDLTICSGVPGSIGSVTVSGYTYSWSPVTGLSDSTASNPSNITFNNTSLPIITNYTLTTTMSASGCQSSDTAIITVNPQPVLTITNPAPVCFPNIVDLTATDITAGSVGGGTLTYWADTNATIPLSNPATIGVSGIYYIKSEASGGCADTNSVVATINQLTVVALDTIEPFYCYNSPVITLIGTPSGGTFSGNTGISSNTFTPSLAGAGTQTVTYEYLDSNLCTNSASQTTTVLLLPDAPAICMVTVDSSSINNIIYWDKSLYTNVDSFIVYREITALDYERIGAVSINSTSMLIDTVRAQYFPFTGDPNVGTYRYKIQILDTCGNYSPMSMYHNTIFVTQNGGTFNWNDYKIEGEPIPIPELNSYLLLRDDLGTGNWNTIGGVSGTQTTISDPNYASYPNARWRIITNWSINCSQTKTLVNSSFSNIKGNGAIIGLPNNDINHNDLLLYPNPLSDKITVEFSNPLNSTYSFTIYDITGKAIREDVVKAGKFIIERGTMNSGFYSIELKGEGKILRGKIIVD